MQNGLRYDPQSQRRQPSDEPTRPKTPQDAHHPTLTIEQTSQCNNSETVDGENYNDGPPSKRRRLADRSQSRLLSPPWKKIAVEGPTSFVEGGRRKSSRTNAVPIELQPPSKRQTRGAIQQAPTINGRHGGPPSYHLTSMNSATSSPVPGKSTKANGRYLINVDKDISSKISVQDDTASKLDLNRSPLAKAHSYNKNHSHPITSIAVNPPRKRGRPRKSALPVIPQNSIRNGYRGGNDHDVMVREDQESEQRDEEVGEPPEPVELRINPKFKPQRLKFKVKMPTVTIQHTKHEPAPRQFGSFREWLEADDALAGEKTPYDTDKAIRREARVRRRLIDAVKPGGILSTENCSVYIPDEQEEPPQQYTHQDHLVAHAVYFRKLMNREHKEHMAIAKRLAHAAAITWEANRPRTEEEMEQEKRTYWKAVYSQWMRDLVSMWGLAKEEVDRQRLEKLDAEQQALEKQALNRVLEQSTQLLDKRRRRGSASASIHSPDSREQSDRASQEGVISEPDIEENMSSSQSESDEGSGGNIFDDDENLTQEELRKKYVKRPTENLDRPPDYGNGAMDADDAIQPAAIAQGSAFSEEPDNSIQVIEKSSHIDNPNTTNLDLDNTDNDLLDDDESIDMEDDMEDSEDVTGSDEREVDEEEGSEEEQGLLGFFSRKELQAPDTPADDEPSEQLNDPEDLDEEIEEVSLIPDASQVQTPSASNSEAPSLDLRKDMSLYHDCSSPIVQLSPSDSKIKLDLKHTANPNKPSPLARLTNSDAEMEVSQDSLPVTPVSSQPLKTQVPTLLRATLREYQHFGLDWLAGLYANRTNGILADEMGLGKTIQTISLLAHLAVEHEVWGPHLIIVPTSVMLNWEMEFKKFLPGFKILTYYGNQEERKQKRKGWLDNDKWHVCITSYQLVLQDQNTFKKRAWHYLVLDEAHNIKNFRSQRWQTLLTFRTRARLLLTGTPLQNNLTELWSLMFFLMPSDSTETGIAGFADLQAFTSWFKKPVDQILEQGRDTMDDEAKELVRRLHGVLRPYLLRRLKIDVEKQMPAKYEHVVYCKLSKRQRYLYDGFMSRAQTKETLASGSYLSIINCLMQLRKVCNHPDLFETRQIVTSFAMPKSAVADYEIKELLIRRRLFGDEAMKKVSLDVINLLPGANEPVSALDTIQNCRLGAIGRLRHLGNQQYSRVLPNMPYDGSSIDTSLTYMDNSARTATLERLKQAAYLTSLRSQRRPLYSHTLMDRLRLDLKCLPSKPVPKQRSRLVDWYLNSSLALEGMVPDLHRRSNAMQTTIQKFACITPAVVAPDLTALALTHPGMEVIRKVQQDCAVDSFHEPRMRLSIAFPDKRLLQYDCGKLQKLDALLRTLQAGGHRALIFTQMTKVLDILEQFLNIHGHKYLRLDGATKVEQRQILTDRFNNDDRILVFILSSRSGGLGINLTGADTVIFYDLDWNPAMDKQCQDRCHRIGQTRDVHIYRFVSEYTIEANILRKSNQKRMLDDVIIQEGDFTTDKFNRIEIKDTFDEESLHEGDAEASAAMDRVLGTSSSRGKMSGQIFEQVEDKEDIAAAKIAEKEIVADDADFDEKTISAGVTTPRTPGPPTPGDLTRPTTATFPISTREGGAETITTLDALQSGLTSTPLMNLGSLVQFDDTIPNHIDDYLISHLEWELRDEPMAQPVEKIRKNAKKGGEHRVKKGK